LVPGPGQALFRLLQQDFPTLPLIAEDLGVITPDVEELRVSFRLPGMRVLQFGFDGAADNPHLPHNYTRDLVAYTGTHDNDTTQGWSAGLTSDTAQRVQAYLRAQADTITRKYGARVLASVAQLAIIPAQDLLRLGSQARLNTPGTATGNWHGGYRPQPGCVARATLCRAESSVWTFQRLKEHLQCVVSGVLSHDAVLAVLAPLGPSACQSMLPKLQAPQLSVSAIQFGTERQHAAAADST
jgi:hypothetical protein